MAAGLLAPWVKACLVTRWSPLLLRVFLQVNLSLESTTHIESSVQSAGSEIRLIRVGKARLCHRIVAAFCILRQLTMSARFDRLAARPYTL